MEGGGGGGGGGGSFMCPTFYIQFQKHIGPKSYNYRGLWKLTIHVGYYINVMCNVHFDDMFHVARRLHSRRSCSFVYLC